VKPIGDIEIFRVIRPQHAVSHREIEDHQVDVELEIRGAADAFENGGSGISSNPAISPSLFIGSKSAGTSRS
jgi:hypothetical protein